MTCVWLKPCPASTWSLAATAAALQEATIVNGRTLWCKPGYGQNLGELVITVDGGKLTLNESGCN